MEYVSILVFFVLFSAGNSVARNGMRCPTREAIPNCWCMEMSYLFRGPYVNCRDIGDLNTLQTSLEGLKGNPVEALELSNVSIPYLPRDGLFRGMHIEYLWIYHSDLKGFAPPGESGPSVFAGLEDTLKTVKLDWLEKLESLDWSELSTMKSLEKIEVTSCNLQKIESSFATLPEGFRYLDLFAGNLTEIQKGAFDLPNLTSVSLGRNEIDRLDRSIFGSKPSKLTSFMFSLNRVKELSEDFFNDLPALTFADIARNKLTKLPSSLKDNWSQFESLYLSFNPYSCDCSLVWLLKAAKENPPKYSDIEFLTCASPQNLVNKTLISLEEKDLCP